MSAKNKSDGMVSVFAPSMSLLAKLGSLAVHIEEMSEPSGHAFDLTAARSIVADREVQAWLDGMRKMALLPVKR